jgi:UDP-glucose 4-epimerase
VHDVARALRAAVGRAGVFNVSTGVETPVARLFELLRTAANVKIEGELAPLRAGELERSCLDSSRARDELGWQAEIGLEEGLGATYHALVAEFDDSLGSRE